MDGWDGVCVFGMCACLLDGSCLVERNGWGRKVDIRLMVARTYRTRLIFPLGGAR